MAVETTDHEPNQKSDQKIKLHSHENRNDNRTTETEIKTRSALHVVCGFVFVLSTREIIGSRHVSGAAGLPSPGADQGPRKDRVGPRFQSRRRGKLHPGRTASPAAAGGQGSPAYKPPSRSRLQTTGQIMAGAAQSGETSIRI